MPPRGASVDYVGLAEILVAISYPVRLELLDRLRLPHALSDLHLAPHRVTSGANPERSVSKQAIHAHLEKLVDAGLVDLANVSHGGRRVNRYSVNLSRFWSLAENLRRLATRHAGREGHELETGTLLHAATREEPSGPRLCVVHGAYEGRTYPLEAAGKSSWTIGRTRGADILLDYDRYVSAKHAVVHREPTGFLLEDVSKNGTRVNWSPVPKGGRRPLRPGDVIGVGQSLLVMSQ